VEFAIVADDARKKTSRTPQKKADTERTHPSEERSVGDFDSAVSSEEGLTRLRKKKLPMRRKSSTAGRAVKQRSADLSFQVGNLLADGRLRNPELATGFAETTMVGDGAEVA
jgi:hypothetical protein